MLRARVVLVAVGGVLSSVGVVETASASDPPVGEIVAQVEALSQERASTIGGNRHALLNVGASASRYMDGRVQVSGSAASEEDDLRDLLRGEDVLVVGDERLNVLPGRVSVELVGHRIMGPGVVEVTARETDVYEYIDEVGG